MNANPLQVLGARIRSLRKERKMSQEDLAEAAGMSVSYTAGIERGAYNPSFEKLQALATVLGTEVSIVYTRERKTFDSHRYVSSTAGKRK